MSKIQHRQRFLIDLYQTWSFVAKDSKANADALIEHLQKRFDLLSDFPELGTKRFRRNSNVRMFSHSRYIILYNQLEDNSGIELIRLIHSARDYHRYFDD